MARILFLTQVLPYPLDAGAKVRNYYVLRHLGAQRQVTLVSFVRQDDSPEAVAHLRALAHAVYTVPMQRSLWRNARAALISAATGRSLIILRDEIAAMRALLRRLVSETPYDAVHADQTSMAQYALYAASRAAASGRRPLLVLDAHNALYRVPERLANYETNPFKRWALAREARALAAYEAGAYRRFDRVVFVTEEDRALFQIPGSRVIPICIDTEERARVERVAHPRAILHLGTMFWPPNVEGVLWFAREVLPLVRREAPDARFVVVGKNPPPSVRQLAGEAAGVEVAGYAPDPRPHLAQAAAFIVPLHAAGGMRVKIVDAWLWGLPIVSTPIGAEGIELHDGDNILIADGAAAFADATVRLLTEPALNARLRAAGRAWVEATYAWQTVYRRVDEVYGTLER
jgi:glycosyltransferase involved in cell wall biosynthesis